MARLSAALTTAAALLLGFVALAQAASQPRTLVVVDEAAVQSVTKLTTLLQENGLNPVVHSLSDAGLALHDGNGGPGYTGLVMLATPVKASTSALGPRALLHFLERGGDVLWATPASQPVPEAWRDFAQEFDVELAGDGSRVQDLSQCATNPQPLAFAQDPGLPSVLRFTAEAVLHNGSSHVLGHHPRLVSILHASPSSFLADSRGVMAEDADAAAGTSLSLVSAFQTAKNSRITFASDAGMLSDGALSANGTYEFASGLLRWSLGITGVVGVTRVTVTPGPTGPSAACRIGSELRYEIDLEADVWPAERPQLEFTMLDPHVRVTLDREPSGTFAANFRAPDRHGVFSAIVDYRQAGWKTLLHRTLVTVTPLRHDEHERFMLAASPYYVGALSTVAVVVAVAAAWPTMSHT